MGKGAFVGDGLDLYVTLDHPAGDLDALLQTFTHMCNQFYEATDGRLHIHNLFWSDGSWGSDLADVVLRADANGGVLGQAHLDGLGVIGAKAEIFASDYSAAARGRMAVAFVHELGHYLWGLRDEYGGPRLEGDIALEQQQAWDSNPTNEYRRVFLTPGTSLEKPVGGGLYDLTDSDVTLYFGEEDQLVAETRIAQQAIALPGGGIELRIDFGAPFGNAPSTAFEQRAYVRPFGRCGEPGANFCVMQARGATTEHEEFCTAGNHDPNLLTAQSHHHAGQSCWSTIVARMAPELVINPPAAGEADTGQPPEAAQVGILQLVKEHRLVLVLDRSGSMADTGKIEGARFGLDLWLSSYANLDDRLGIVWYDHEIETSLAVSRVSDIADLDAVKDNVLALEPRGSTNIRDALDRAADLLIAASSEHGRPVHQGVLLLSDGVHNTPPPATAALEVVPKFKENGITIFTLALGASSQVNLDVLESLALQTSGRAFTAPVDLSPEVGAGAIALELSALNLQFRGTAVAETDLDVAELAAGGVPGDKLAKALQKGARPSWPDLLKLLGRKDLADLLKGSRGLATTTSFQVEEGASRAEALLWFPQKQPLWLYLLGPDGHPAPEDTIRPVRGRSPFDGAQLRGPKPGRWIAVAVRPSPGPAFRAQFIAGVENRRLAVSGDCDKLVPVGSACRLWARASLRGELSGLDVRAVLRGPGGAKHHLVLSDVRADEPFSGLYEGWFVPAQPGHFTGRITVTSRGKAVLANGLDRLAHSPPPGEKGRRLELGTTAGVFQRVIRISFEAGARPEPKDRDQELGLVGKYRRRQRFGKTVNQGKRRKQAER